MINYRFNLYAVICGVLCFVCDTATTQHCCYGFLGVGRRTFPQNKSVANTSFCVVGAKDSWLW